MRVLTVETLLARAAFLDDVRAFFRGQGCLEVETPLLNATGSVEPFLDSLKVTRPPASAVDRKPGSAPGGSHAGYLITSPEYNLKKLLGEVGRDLFQIAHCFRAGEGGELHSEEFLMLEWYRLGRDEFALMDECDALFRFLCDRPYARASAGRVAQGPALRRSVSELLKRFAGCDLSRESLLAAVRRHGLQGTGEAALWRYDELFFTVFLNLVEGELGREGPEFVYHYPRELAALSRIEGALARRFEIYWQGVELANGYFELDDPVEQAERFRAENELRAELGKAAMPMDEGLLEAVGRLGDCAGIALGLDRLFMLLRGEKDLRKASPFV